MKCTWTQSKGLPLNNWWFVKDIKAISKSKLDVSYQKQPKIWWGLDSRCSLPSLSRPHGLTCLELYEFVSVEEWNHKIELLKDCKCICSPLKRYCTKLGLFPCKSVRLWSFYRWVWKWRAGRLEQMAPHQHRVCSLYTQGRIVLTSLHLCGGSVPKELSKITGPEGGYSPVFSAATS